MLRQLTWWCGASAGAIHSHGHDAEYYLKIGARGAKSSVNVMTNMCTPELSNFDLAAGFVEVDLHSEGLLPPP